MFYILHFTLHKTHTLLNWNFNAHYNQYNILLQYYHFTFWISSLSCHCCYCYSNNGMITTAHFITLLIYFTIILLKYYPLYYYSKFLCSPYLQKNVLSYCQRMLWILGMWKDKPSVETEHCCQLLWYTRLLLCTEKGVFFFTIPVCHFQSFLFYSLVFF